MAADDCGERSGQPGMRIDRVHLAGFDQLGDDGPVFGTGVVACEEGVLAVQGDGSNGAFDGVVVDLDTSVRHEAAKAVTVFCDIGQCRAEWRFGRGAGAVVQQPVIEAGEDGGGTRLPHGEAGGGVANADIGVERQPPCPGATDGMTGL